MKYLSKIPYFLLLAFMALNPTQAQAQSQIAFEVSFTEPQAHYADVQMQISGNSQAQLDVKMPVWAPGSYLVREFAKNVENFSAADASGNALSVQKINKNTWRIQTNKKKK